ncbi:MAG: DEAD/DEAH box helicase [Planctomycetota bacterium]|nr:DEAD/DEAH box helicase [Planctomycetota bacterium]
MTRPENPNRSLVMDEYLALLPYPPYPVQEEALLAWFADDQGALVCAPTGTGKTAIAHAAMYEALRTGTKAYYTTPLIALTDQKFHELREEVERWGFPAESVGLVTGNRRVNPDAPLLVVVAEILLNRLLHPETSLLEGVGAVVMDEFHNFADPERGIVWELSLAHLPKTARLLLLSATVGNAREFLNWLDRCHGRKLEFVEGLERKVPLSFHYVPDDFLAEQLTHMAKGEGPMRKTPALVFCFNRDQCWSVAEILKGQDLMPPGVRQELLAALEQEDFKRGAGPKLIQVLRRGIGVHHAGLLPRYRRIVEKLFERKLLSVAVCTETLAAGINLPARSVIITSLAKGQAGKQKLIDPSTAAQIFGRAGRPQYDDKGFVYCMAHEDDVRLTRWKRLFEAIPETTKDPALMRKRKELKRKKPEKSDKMLYWTEPQFLQLQQAAPVRLYSKGPLPWRLLAYMLSLSPEVNRIRSVIRKRLLDAPRIKAGEAQLERMLLALHQGGYVRLEPTPPEPAAKQGIPIQPGQPAVIQPPYEQAHATASLGRLLAFRGVNPLLADWLCPLMARADDSERLQLLEGLLEVPGNLAKALRVPEDIPHGPLQTGYLDPELVQKGLIASVPEDDGDAGEEEPQDRRFRERPPTLADRARMLFEALHPEVGEAPMRGIWAAGEILGTYNGNFEFFARNRDLVRQEGILFRHLLRLILLAGEFARVPPAGSSDKEATDWVDWMRSLAVDLTAACEAVDPQSTETVAGSREDPLLLDDAGLLLPPTPRFAENPLPPPARHFGAGLEEELD